MHLQVPRSCLLSYSFPIFSKTHSPVICCRYCYSPLRVRIQARVRQEDTLSTFLRELPVEILLRGESARFFASSLSSIDVFSFCEKRNEGNDSRKTGSNVSGLTSPYSPETSGGTVEEQCKNSGETLQRQCISRTRWQSIRAVKRQPKSCRNRLAIAFSSIQSNIQSDIQSRMQGCRHTALKLKFKPKV